MLTVMSGFGDSYIKDDDAYYVITTTYLLFML